MIKTLTLQDYQAISAYLDNACSEKERDQIEKRILDDPELNQALLEFKHTRRLLRAMPVRRAPRNFTLSGSRVPARPQRFFLAPALNFVALTAAILMVAVFASSQFFPGFWGSQQAARSASPMAANVADAQTSTTNAPMIITWNEGESSAKAAGKGGLGGGNGAVESQSFSSAVPSVGVAPAVNPTAEPSGMGAPPQTLMATQAAQDSTSSDGSNLILGIPDSSDQGKVISTSGTSKRKTTKQRDFFPIVEIGLGILALISAVVAFIVRKLH
jgi:hypothetical protein